MCFDCFLPANTTNKKSLNHKNFNKPSLCTIISRPETFETETRKNGSRDSITDDPLSVSL